MEEEGGVMVARRERAKEPVRRKEGREKEERRQRRREQTQIEWGYVVECSVERGSDGLKTSSV